MHTTLMLLHHVLAVAPKSGSSSKKGSSLVPFVVLLALFGVAYFIFLRPARNRQRAAVETKRSVAVGDEVTTTAGLIATVIAVDDDMLTLEVAPGVHCRYLPAAILRVNGDEEPDPETSDASNHEVIDDPAAAAIAPDDASHDDTTYDDPTIVAPSTDTYEPGTGTGSADSTEMPDEPAST